MSECPVLLIWYHNQPVYCWVNYKCKYSLIGRWLVCLFVGMLMGTKIVVQAEWISTHLNCIANDISHFQKESVDGNFDYAQLTQTYPVLCDC